MEKAHFMVKGGVERSLLIFIFGLFFLLGWAENLNCALFAEDLHRRALNLARAGKAEQSLPLFKKALSLDPDNLNLAADFIIALSWAGHYKEALQLYARYFKDYMPPPYVFRELGRAAYALGQYEKALKFYREAYKYRFCDQEVIKGLFFSFCKLKRYEKARNLLPHPCLSPETRLFLRFFLAISLRDLEEAYELWLEALNEGIATRDWENLLFGALKTTSYREMIRLFTLFTAPKDRFLVLAVRGQFEEALRYIQGEDTSNWPLSYQAWIGWCYFKLGRLTEAKQSFQKVLERNPRHFFARLGQTYVLSALKEFQEAERILKSLEKDYPHSIDVLFVKAFFFEKQKKFLKAILIYEEILKRKPQDPLAFRLMVRNYSDLGFPSVALEKWKRDDPFAWDLTLDEAREFFWWGLYSEAEKLLKEVLKKDPDNQRALFDLTVLLAEEEKYRECLKQYQVLIDKDLKIPPWVEQARAKSLLALGKSKEALNLFQKIVKKHPTFEAYMGLYYSLVEERRWKEAEEVLEILSSRSMEKRSKEGRAERKREVETGQSAAPDWRRFRLAVEKGWLFAYQDRLQEAQTYLEKLKSQAPAANEVRAALGHVYLWRGWPRRAYIELGIAHTRDPDDITIQTGLAYVLNERGQKEKAREIARKLREKHPENPHVKHLYQNLLLEERPEFFINFTLNADDDGADEWSWFAQGSQNLSLYTRLYAYFLWKKSALDREDLDDSYKRLGLGFSRDGGDWDFGAEISGDVRGKDKIGLKGWVSYAFDDQWHFSVSYNSFSTDVPLRARDDNISVSDLSVLLTYRESEWQQFSIITNFRDFSDNNERYSILGLYEHGLFIKGNFLDKSQLEVYYSHGTKDDVVYFNPKNDLSVSITNILQYTHYRYYDRFLIHRLVTSIGLYAQESYTTKPIARIRLEEECALSKTKSFFWSAEIARHVYDGEAVTSINFNIFFKVRF